mmetsp:Transcript_98317/g.282721  ORF Transcript_98317/g.282721 Transcript_98317/m.282721 type:complete len:124 (-) Transcript_98317:204-575(-)
MPRTPLLAAMAASLLAPAALLLAVAAWTASGTVQGAGITTAALAHSSAVAVDCGSSPAGLAKPGGAMLGVACLAAGALGGLATSPGPAPAAGTGGGGGGGGEAARSILGRISCIANVLLVTSI